MRIDIITVLPEMIEGFFNCSIMKRAQNKGLAEIHIHNLRDYTEDKYRRVDDYPFGGFAGMVMKIEPIERCINALKAERVTTRLSLPPPTVSSSPADGKYSFPCPESHHSLWAFQRDRLPDSRASHHQGNQHRRLCADWWRTGGGRHGRCHRPYYSGSDFR